MNTWGNTVWTSGTVNGAYVNTYTTNYGNSSYTTGQIGGQNYYNNSTQIGNYRYSNGNIGDTNYNSTALCGIGNTYYTNSRYSPRW